MSEWQFVILFLVTACMPAIACGIATGIEMLVDLWRVR